MSKKKSEKKEMKTKYNWAILSKDGSYEPLIFTTRREAEQFMFLYVPGAYLPVIKKCKITYSLR